MRIRTWPSQFFQYAKFNNASLGAKEKQLVSSNNFDEITNIAQQSIQKMIELGIPANPFNYMIWYHYFANSYPDLKRAIDVLLENKQEFDDAQCARIHEKYFSNEYEGAVFDGAASDLGGIIGRAVKFLDEAGTDAAEFGETLADASGGLAAENSPNDAREIIAGVVNATQEMSARQKDLEERLVMASTEVADLRREIEVTRQEAATDGLTGLANRKRFDVTLRDTAAEMMEIGDNMCLLMIDIDFFKKFNDNHGHQIGDQVLKLMAFTMNECIKGQDTAARYGGEEFCVILPHTDLKPATHLANVIRESVARKNIINKASGDKLGGITLSIGVAKYNFGEPLSELIKRADTALYAAKNQGRNRVLSESDIADKLVSAQK
jgi:diguanylate cyclase